MVVGIVRAFLTNLSALAFEQADYKEQIPRQVLRFMGDNASKCRQRCASAIDALACKVGASCFAYFL